MGQVERAGGQGLPAVQVISRLALASAALIALLPAADAAQRSKAARAEFTRQNPCPSTGRYRGACPGFEVDHIEPLCAGGADIAANMQWISREDHKVKTRKDIKHCRLSPALK